MDRGEHSVTLPNVPRVRERMKLIEGRMMRCPRCEKLHDILQYVPLTLIEKFARETTMIYKCPKCSWIFAPVDDVVIQFVQSRNGSNGN